jgi:creatinase
MTRPGNARNGANGARQSLARFENGEKVRPTFSAEEMGRRLGNLRRHMADNDLDGVLLTSYHNVNYFADFLYCSFGRKYGLVVTHDKATSISAGIDGGRAYRRTFGDNLAYTDWRKDNYFLAVKELIKGAKRLGVEFDHVSVDLKRQLEDALPGVELVDVGVATMWMRTIKSHEEIALIKEGARICDAGGWASAAAIAVGVPEHEVAIASTDAMIRESARSFPHFELMDTWTWVQSGINTDGAHNPVTSRVIEAGDIVSINCFPMLAGYYTALERTLFCESASDRHLDLWEKNCAVHRRGLALVRPGAHCCDIATELNEMYRSYGLLQYRSFGYGHSFGILCHYYGREAGVELREDVDTLLRPGMVVSMEPMIMIPAGQAGAGGYREHDILVVTEEGAEDITKFPFGPAHNIIGKRA